MKTALFYGLCACIFVSCTTEGGGTATTRDSSPALSAARITGVTTSNPDNPLDLVGAIYSALYEGYYADSTRASYGTFDDVAAYASGQELYGSLAQNGSLAADSATLEALVLNAAVSPDAALANSGLSPEGQASLLGLIAELSQMYEAGDPYQQVYGTLVSYEAAIATEEQLTVTDKTILLTTTAVIRQDATVRKPRKRKDRDWEFSIGHIVATAYGATESEAAAVIYGLGATFN